MKSKRHTLIREIIGKEEIETQEELAEALRKHSFDVTQATVSRDIKELMLRKVPMSNGRSRYAVPADTNRIIAGGRSVRMFQDSVMHVDSSENIVVMKTLPGTANAIASILDHEAWTDVIGTVAGDDTILLVIKPTAAVPKVMERLRFMMAGGR
ncbi:arginine repressor [Selenomonas sp. TAMA-11512]|uniref:arginine repressor n=1 Tax=Selenomonas sp. TAMA-11512 TaxID=3095337 RepID=UPI00308543C1|nr:arginine repressor [Selenomonas sp. TAMA-11512]